MKLKCLEHCNPPKTSITWVKDGIFLSSGPVYEKTNMKTNDSGNYSCIVLNSVGKELEYVVILINKSYVKYNDGKCIFYCVLKQNSLFYMTVDNHELLKKNILFF